MNGTNRLYLNSLYLNQYWDYINKKDRFDYKTQWTSFHFVLMGGVDYILRGNLFDEGNCHHVV